MIWPFRLIFALGLESSAHRLMEHQEWREAREVYGRLIRWSPRQATYYTEAGLVHMLLGEWEPAEDRLREAIRLDPNAFRAYDLLGVLLANQRRIDEAQETWERSILLAGAMIEARPFLFGSYGKSRIEEARSRLAAMEEPGFDGFPIEAEFSNYSGTTPSSAD